MAPPHQDGAGFIHNAEIALQQPHLTVYRLSVIRVPSTLIIKTIYNCRKKFACAFKILHNAPVVRNPKKLSIVHCTGTPFQASEETKRERRVGRFRHAL